MSGKYNKISLKTPARLRWHERISVRVRVAVNDYAGHPFTFALSRELARRGHEVLYLYTTASGGPKAAFSTETEGSLSSRTIDISRVDKQNLLGRRRKESQYGAKVATEMQQWGPDVVVSGTTPLDAQKRIQDWSRSQGVPFVFWLQDVISIAVRSLLKKRLGPLVGPVAYLYERLERRMLLGSDAVVCICEEFRDILAKWGVNDEKIGVLANWGAIEDIPVLPKSNGFSSEHGLDSRFVVLYSGTMGMKHDPGVIIRLARAFEKDREMLFLVVSEGVGADFLRTEVERQEMDNIRMMPLQPFSVFPQMLASADLHLVLLEQEAGVFSVPSKLWSYYCSGRPTMVLVPEENAAARITREADAGVVASVDRFDEVLEATRRLRGDQQERKRLGANARRYAEENFKVSDKAKWFEEIFSSIAGSSA